MAAPALDDDFRLGQAVEDLAVEQLVAELRVEALAVSVLPGRPKRRWTPKDDGAPSIIADNILDRDFEADRPNQKWLADFTYIPTAEGWLYVAVVLDLFSRRAVGWSMKADRMQKDIRCALHERPLWADFSR